MAAQVVATVAHSVADAAVDLGREPPPPTPPATEGNRHSSQKEEEEVGCQRNGIGQAPSLPPFNTKIGKDIK